MLKALTKHIANETTLVLDRDLFAGHCHVDGQDTAVIVIESGGVGDFYLTDKVEKTFQVISRARDYHVARDNAQTVYDALHGAAGEALPVIDGGTAWYANAIEAIALPQSLGQDDRGLFVISTNFVVRAQHSEEG